MLDDIVILEAGSRISTGYAGKLLRDAGATVVRLEPADGDPHRTAEPAYAEYLHAGKASITDLTSAGGRALVERVDIVLCDEEPAVQELVTELRARRPEIVVVAVSPYGLTGPGASSPANDFTLQAEAGISLVHPTRDRPAVSAGVPLSELTAGGAAAMSVVIGLLAADAGADDVTADVSLFEAAVALQQFPWLNNRIEHHTPYPLPQAPIPGIERAKDGWVAIVSVTPPQWKDFKRIANVPALDDPRFDVLGDRIVLADEVTALVREFTMQHTVDDLVELGAANRVPIVPVTTPGSIASIAPFAARESFVPSADGDFIQPRPPFRVDADASWTPARLAAVGQDDDRDWSELPPRTRNVAGGIDVRLPLAGLKVVELGTFQAGPLVTLNLASLGAEVVKIETVNRPDLIRYNGVPMSVDRSWERASSFIAVNLGKLDVTADLADPRGLAVVRELIAEADVVLENYGPRVLEARGLDYDGVRAINPDVVMVRMPAWGLDGPWRDRPGFTYTVNAASGMAELTGYADGEPLLTGTVVDPFAALVCSFVTLAAIRRRRVTGRGAFLEVPLCDVAIQLTAEAVVQQSATGTVRTRSGNDSATAVPQDVFRTDDDAQVAVSVESDEQWAALATLPWAKAWAGDERLASTAGRREHLAEIDEHLRAAAGGVDAAQFVADLHGAGIPAARLEVGDDVVVHPQLLARGRIVEIGHPVNGPHRYVAGPVMFTGGPDFVPHAPAPLFGQHNDEILARLGRTDDEIAALWEEGLISDSPFNTPFDRTAPLR
jgi:crotonobetainyl-CoA:carnitine CoA-transferase CaiB-like acyl-CoA transferase